MKQRFMTSTTCENAWCNLFWVWPEHHRRWRNHLRSCVRVGGGHFDHILWYARNSYFVVNFTRWSCVYFLFLVFRLSQGSVASLLRWGGWSSYLHMCCSFQNLTVKTELKSIDFFYKVTDKNKLPPSLRPTVYVKGLTSVSRPSIISMPLSLKYSCSNITKLSRFSIFNSRLLYNTWCARSRPVISMPHFKLLILLPVRV